MPSILDSAKHGLVLLPASGRETLRALGRDAKTWLNGLVTSDLKPVTAGQGGYGLLLSKQGKIQSDLEIVAQGESLLFTVAEGLGAGILESLEHFLIMEDVELSAAPELDWLRFVGRPELATRVLSGSSLEPHQLDWTGLGGTLCFVPKPSRGEILSKLAQSDDLVRATPEQAKFLSLACGFPEYGVDYGSDQNPHEAALDRRAVSWNKGCYLGQEVVCMQDMRGKVKRRLVILELEAGSAPTRGAAISATEGGESVGELTSVASDAGRTLAFARMKAPHFESAQPLYVEGAGAARILAPATLG
ncbi:MAG TPA: hypothetical protein VFQ61_36430 [Polyangiaceae bacterium]|nr:hypothetical protein [Polyangiaceae bacterium]